MSTENNSTLKSYIDSATGAVQSAVGNIVGNRGDQVRLQSFGSHSPRSHN